MQRLAPRAGFRRRLARPRAAGPVPSSPQVRTGVAARRRSRAVRRNCGPYGRDIGWLVYCGGTVAPGGQAVLTFTVTPSAAGTYTLKSYARQTYTTDGTWSSVTLTAG